MLNIFTLANGRLFQEEIESLEELSRFQPIWVDLESPCLLYTSDAADDHH
jgi:magnesium transporter